MFCLVLHVSGTIHHDCHSWYIFLKIFFFFVHFFKNFFFFFFFFHFSQNLDFLGCYWVKRAKNGPKWPVILSVLLHISGTIHHVMVIYGTHVYNDNISRIFFHFSKLWYLESLGWVKGQKMTQNNKNFSVSLLISGTIHHMNCDFWYTWVKWWYVHYFFHFFSKSCFFDF